MTKINNKIKEYAFVLDSKGNKLAPTNTNNAWILIRKRKAKLLQKYPMAIQLNYEVKNIKKTIVNCGIDDGSVYVGISLVQEQQTYNKPIFKGTIKQREDVHNLMIARLWYRNYHRFHKRYRKKRFNNRNASTRKGRVTPSILQKKQAIMRVINMLNKFIDINAYYLEDVAIDIRALT